VTAAQKRARAASIRSHLVQLSRNGWRDAKPSDYQPLEQELRDLTDSIKRNRK